MRCAARATPICRRRPPACSRWAWARACLHAELAARYDTAGAGPGPGYGAAHAAAAGAPGLHSALAIGSVYAMPWPALADFDAVLSTFAFSAFVDADAALDEMVRVTKPGGRVIIVDAGEALDGNRMAHLLARSWEAMGDFMRDEVPLMQARGLAVQREDYGPWGCVHVTVGRVAGQGEDMSEAATIDASTFDAAALTELGAAQLARLHPRGRGLRARGRGRAHRPHRGRGRASSTPS